MFAAGYLPYLLHMEEGWLRAGAVLLLSLTVYGLSFWSVTEEKEKAFFKGFIAKLFKRRG